MRLVDWALVTLFSFTAPTVVANSDLHSYHRNHFTKSVDQETAQHRVTQARLEIRNEIGISDAVLGLFKKKIKMQTPHA